MKDFIAGLFIRLLTFLGVGVFFYICGAFTSGYINPMDWDSSNRGALLIMSGIVAVFLIVAYVKGKAVMLFFKQLWCKVTHGHEWCASLGYMRLTCAWCGKVIRFNRITRP